MLGTSRSQTLNDSLNEIIVYMKRPSYFMKASFTLYIPVAGLSLHMDIKVMIENRSLQLTFTEK